MSLAAGTRLGPYEILSPLGAGGMGEVYRARDTKLNRDAALKVLPETLSHDAERMARFKREAQVLASLNHPNIATIYGFEESDGVRALAMELVEGQTLAERIAVAPVGARPDEGRDRRSDSGTAAAHRAALQLDDALPIAKQIADALEYAHERGIIHRDLKPANVKVTPEGTVKVLDFGLAKALDLQTTSSDLSNSPTMSPTLSIAATQAGVIIGTAAYMSPEQARGKTVDRRADIWAFGCVLFEMLSGRKPYEGETVTDILAAVVVKEPDWDALPENTPRRIGGLIRRCLLKDPKQRLRDIGEARIAIEETISGSVAPLDERRSDEKDDAGPRPALQRALPWAIAAITTVAMLLALAAYWRAERSGPASQVELSLTIPANRQLSTADGPAFAISPDGSRIAYMAGETQNESQIYVRALNQSVATPLEGATGSSLFFSPDGQWIGFFGRDGRLKKVSVFGGAPVELAPADSNRGGTWGEDGTIVYPSNVTSPLYQIPASGGIPSQLTHLDHARNEITHRWPRFLPGGKTVIFTASSDNNDFSQAAVEAVALATGKSKVLIENAYFGRYLPTGDLTYVSGNTLFAVPFDPDSLKVTGSAMPIIQNIQADLTNGSAQFSFSNTGTVVYTTGKGLGAENTVDLLDPEGHKTLLITQPGNYYWPSFSPDGKRLAVSRDSDVYVYDIPRAKLTRMTFSQPACSAPVWTPDGKWISCARATTSGNGMGISWFPADGSGRMEPLTEGSKVRQYPFSWTPDGRTMVFAQNSLTTGVCCEFWTLPVGADGKPEKPELFLKEEGREGYFAPAISPDGRWLAYNSYVSGVPQVFVVPYPGPGGKWQVSVTSGEFPKWSRTENKLYFISNEPVAGLHEAPYSVQGNTFQPGKPTLLFQGGFVNLAPFGFYDIAPDGKHFAMFEPVTGDVASSPAPTVVLNWFDRVRQLMATAQK